MLMDLHEQAMQLVASMLRFFELLFSRQCVQQLLYSSAMEEDD